LGGGWFSPKSILSNNPEGVVIALTKGPIEDNKEAFLEILEGLVKTGLISKVVKEMGISRAVVFEAMDKCKNPTISSLCKIVEAFKVADLKEATQDRRVVSF
jgi:DNA-binding phage protein